MILDFKEDVDAIIKAMGLDPDDATVKHGMAISMCLVKVLDRGISWERDRIVRIIQQHAMNPGDLLQKIRKPIR